jgi:endonuclease YncB( thermonuclease family)
MARFLTWPMFVLVLLVPSLGAAHSGGLDKYGCHHNTTTGDYHCHRGVLAGHHFSSQEAMLAALAAERDAARAAKTSLPAPQVRTVTRVVDGDTLILHGGERVRLIGVDTPETVHPRKPVQCFGREASKFTKRLAQGRTVRLEFDQANAHVLHRDKYQRTLAYVYLANGLLINREIIRQGYGHAYTRYPFRYLEDFRAAEREARQNGRGLWGACRLAAAR